MRYVRRLAACAFWVCVLSVGAWAQEGHPNFSGTWILNQSLSNGHGEDLSDYKQIKTIILHDDPRLAITTIGIKDGATREQSVYFTDSRGETNQFGNSKHVTRSTWNGNKLLTKGASGGVQVTSEWQLSKDGKRLTRLDKFTVRTTLMWNGKVERVDEQTSKLLRVYERAKSDE